MAFLTVIGLFVIIALIANIRQDKSNKEYDKYLASFKPTTIDFNPPKKWYSKFATYLEGEIGTYETTVDENGFQRVKINL